MAGAAHVPNMEKPAEFNREVLSFLLLAPPGRIDEARAELAWAAAPARNLRERAVLLERAERRRTANDFAERGLPGNEPV